MKIPKIEKNDLLKYGTDMNEDTLYECIRILREEQGDEFTDIVLYGGLQNVNMFYGFITTYMILRDALIRQECDELEKMLREETS